MHLSLHRDMADKGSPLNPETVSYFRLIAQNLANVSDDEKQILVQNVHSEMEGKEYRLSVNKNCSQILETIFSFSSPFHLRRFLNAVTELIYELTFDRNGSHVLQAILKRAPSILIKEFEENTIDNLDEGDDDDDDDGAEKNDLKEGVPSLTRIFINICSKLKERGWLDVVYDTFGSHIARDIVAICGGYVSLPQKEKPSENKNEIDEKFQQQNKQNNSNNNQIDQIKLEFSHLKPLSHILPSILQEITRQTSQDLCEMQFNASASPLLQLLLTCLSKQPTYTQDLHAFVSRLLLWKSEADDTFSHESQSVLHVKNLLTSKVGSYILEKIIECASHTQILFLYRSHLQANFYEYSLDPHANFSIQHLIKRIISVDELTEIITKLEGNFKELLEKNRTGVIRWLVEACLRLKTGHANIVKALHLAVEIKNPKFDRSFVSRFLNFSSSGGNKKISVMNCAILETLMSFPFELMGRIIDSFLAIDTHELVTFACDASSSRVIEAYMSSSTFNDHVKHKLIDRFIGNFVILALNKYGSFVLEKLFLQANKTRRVAIVVEMTPAEERLGRAQTGRMLLSKFKIPLFKRAQHVWEEQMRANQKTSALFADITDDIEMKAPDEKVVKAKPENPTVTPSEQAPTKKRKPDEAAAAAVVKSVKLTDQKKKLKSLAHHVVGDLSGDSRPKSRIQQSTPSIQKPKKRKTVSAGAAVTAQAPKSNPAPLPPGVLSRKEKRAARQAEHRKQKAGAATVLA